MQKVMWAIEIWVNDPWPPKRVAKEQEEADPHHVSGVTIAKSRAPPSAPASAGQSRQAEPQERPERHRCEDCDPATWRVTPRAPRMKLVREQARIPIEGEPPPS